MAIQVHVMAVLTAKPGRGSALEALLRGMAAPSRAEPGNIHYNLWRNRDVEHQFVLDEAYVDAAANASHRVSPHFQNYVSQVNDLADRIVLVLDAVDTQ